MVINGLGGPVCCVTLSGLRFLYYIVILRDFFKNSIDPYEVLDTSYGGVRHLSRQVEEAQRRVPPSLQAC